MQQIPKLALLFFTSFLLNYSSFSQVNFITDYNDYSRQFSLSAPDVYTFEKFNFAPVNHYTGRQTTKVPIYKIKTGGIEYPIALNYSMGGIKVDQLASDVGLGWSMSKAIITRTVVHDNDFDNTGSQYIRPDWNLYTESEKNADWEAKLDYHTKHKVGFFLQKAQNIKIGEQSLYVDYMPDIYNVYAGDFSTSFFFNDENSPVEINPKGTKIEAFVSTKRFKANRVNFMGQPEVDLPTRDFFTIIITTNKGIKYTFSDCDLSLNQTLQAQGFYGDMLKAHGAAQVSSWNITKIEDLNTGKKIDFKYKTTHSNPNNNNLKYGQRVFEIDDYPENNWHIDNCAYYTPYADVTTDYNRIDRKIFARIDVEKKVLTKIIFDEGNISFNYNHENIGGPGVGRRDVFNADFLTQIYINDYNNKLIKSYNLDYDLFRSDYNVGEFNPDGENNSFRYTRLKLNSVTETGKPPYTFTYEETTKLPPVNSFSFDFLGYANGSPDLSSWHFAAGSLRPCPTLYYYPNKFEKSLLPFPVPGEACTTIQGRFNRQSNLNYSKAWSLKKIEFPTGGFNEFEYELNEFEVFGKTIQGGGIRIKKQTLDDGNGNKRELVFDYKSISGTTSGTLNTYPYFGHPTYKFFPVLIDYSQNQTDIFNYPIETGNPPVTGQNTTDWKIHDKSKLNADITTGAYIGYSRVIEREVGKGYKELLFTSNDSLNENKNRRVIPQMSYNIWNIPLETCATEFIIANSAFGNQIFSDNSYKRGKLLEENIFDESSKLVKKTKIDYFDKRVSNVVYAQAFFKPKKTQNDQRNLQGFLTVDKHYWVNQFLPVKESISIFTDNGEEQKTEKNFTFNTIGLPQTISTTDSKGDNFLTNIFYPTDVINSSSLPGDILNTSELNGYISLKSNSLNNISEHVQFETLKNSNKIKSVRRTFNLTNGLVLPETIKVSKANGSFFNKYSTTSYDSGTANPVEISEENGIKSVLIWGYKKTKLIAKIDNIDLVTINSTIISNLQSLSDADNDNCKTSNCKEEQLRTSLNNLRASFPNTMITTYTHDPLIGITSITNHRGETIYYEYDQFNRLKAVRDHLGNLVSENEYNYKN